MLEVAQGSGNVTKKRKVTLRDAGFAAGGAGVMVIGKWVVKKIIMKLAESAYEEEEDSCEAEPRKVSANN